MDDCKTIVSYDFNAPGKFSFAEIVVLGPG
jgi:hypothetical protein